MKNRGKQLFYLFTFMFALTTAAAAGQYSGLWAGDAVLYQVSEVNKSAADLGFDLKLEAYRSKDTLTTRAASGWKYNDSGNTPSSGWNLLTYNDAAWASGQSPLGFCLRTAAEDPCPQNNTTVGNKTTVYFRKQFAASSPGRYSNIELGLMADDGVSVYLNGNEIIRNNLPVSFVGVNTVALSETLTSAEGTYRIYTLPANLLLDGQNILAAEVHKSSTIAAGQPGADKDLRFDLELKAVVSAPAVPVLVPERADNWYYYSNYSYGEDLGSLWKEKGYASDFANYQALGWLLGKGKFGYGNVNISSSMSGQDTLLDPGDPNSKHRTHYFRKHFNIAAGAGYTDMNLYLLRDDGAVVYINGQEVARSNMPASGTVLYTTYPLINVGPDEAMTYQTYKVSADMLVDGDNVIAVEVHQHKDELSDKTTTTPPTDTPAELTMHVLLHVDDAGSVRLLKDVIFVRNPNNNNVVMLTDDTLVANYAGVEVKDGKSIGRRISAVGIDFDDQAANGNLVKRTVLCSGSFSLAANCSFTIGRRMPTNPFLHRYNPDHDEMDSFYTPIPNDSTYHEVLEIGRDITFEFSNRYPPDTRLAEGAPPPGWGDTEMGGIFRETITGLHKDALKILGSFSLRRITTRGVLNE